MKDERRYVLHGDLQGKLISDPGNSPGQHFRSGHLDFMAVRIPVLVLEILTAESERNSSESVLCTTRSAFWKIRASPVCEKHIQNSCRP
jgi:hypothetical protein